METTMTLDYQHYFENGVSYPDYYEGVAAAAQRNDLEGNDTHIPLNFQRMKRLGKTFHMNDDTAAVLRGLTGKIHWLVISENWCGDSAQLSPVMNALAEASEGKIDLRFVYRDQEPALMDAHLTHGKRSIPILIQLDADFRVTGTWGPRPAAAQALTLQLKSDPATAANYSEVLHKWYADDKQQAIQAELQQLLTRTAPASAI
jgi:Thioredoxin